MAAQDYTKKNQGWGKFDFMGPAKYLTAFSLALTALGFVLIATKGFKYGVDFAGGIETQVAFQNAVGADQVRSFMSEIGYPNANVQALGTDNEFLIRVESPKAANDSETNKAIQATVDKIKSGLETKFAEAKPEIRRTDTVGPQVGAELRRNGILAGFYCVLLILVYVGLRFDYRYAPPAVICLVHDAGLTLAIYSLLGWEVTTQTMAAILTLIGYSLNDTIVIFDRIRENAPVYRDKDLYWVSNLSINETLSRTILTYITTMIVVSSMVIFADGVIQDFAITLMIGMFLGVYSTVYIATPLVLVIDRYHKWKKQQQLAAA